MESPSAIAAEAFAAQTPSVTGETGAFRDVLIAKPLVAITAPFLDQDVLAIPGPNGNYPRLDSKAAKRTSGELPLLAFHEKVWVSGEWN